MAVRLGVNAFAVKPKVFSNAVNERTLALVHWFEAETLLYFIGCEQAQRFFLFVRPGCILKIDAERRSRIRNMIIFVSIRYVQRLSKIPIPLQPCTFVIAFQRA
jgi:hypothetical protein